MSNPLSNTQSLRQWLSAFAFWAALMLCLCVVCGGTATAKASDVPTGEQHASDDASELDTLVSLAWPGQFPEDERPSPQALLDECTSQLRVVSEQWKPCYCNCGKVVRGGWRLPKVSHFYGSFKAEYTRRSLQVLFCRWAV